VPDDVAEALANGAVDPSTLVSLTYLRDGGASLFDGSSACCYAAPVSPIACYNEIACEKPSKFPLSAQYHVFLETKCVMTTLYI